MENVFAINVGNSQDVRDAVRGVCGKTPEVAHCRIF